MRTAHIWLVDWRGRVRRNGRHKYKDDFTSYTKEFGLWAKGDGNEEA